MGRATTNAAKTPTKRRCQSSAPDTIKRIRLSRKQSEVPKKPEYPEGSDAPKKVPAIQVEVVRPSFWSGHTATGLGPRAKRRETIKALTEAYTNIIHYEADLTFDQRRELFPYIFWPPLPRWCLVPFDMQACPKAIRTDEGALNPLIYGLGANSTDPIWKQAVLGVFKPQRRQYQMFDHILIPIHHPWQDDSMPEEVPMWGLVHYQKGSGTAYVHVLTGWQKWVFGNSAGDKRWAKDLVKTLTGETGVDENLFLGDIPAINIKWVAHKTGPEWDNLGWRANEMDVLADMTYLYILHVALHLAVNLAKDNKIPSFGADDATWGLAQALLGISTALEHGEASKIKSVCGGITEKIREDPPDAAKEHRRILDYQIPGVVSDFHKTLERRLGQNMF